MNKFLVRRTLTLIFAAALLLAAPTVYAQQKPKLAKNSRRTEKVFKTEPFLRTELFFGRNKPDGSEVSRDEWQRFLAGEVTPRFPAGFTVLEGYGQFREAGEIIRENSFVLIVVYPLETRRASSRKIDEIRKAYLKTFQQKSVLRVDFPQTVRVSF
jgi:hypothetical protein